MTDQQITTLSRQFAEEMCSEMEDSFEKDEAINVYELHFQLAMGFLKERFCLVEKQKVEEEYYEATFTCDNVDPFSETFATSLAQKSMLERLFPGIGKEVENEH